MVKRKKIAICIDSSLLLAEIFENSVHTTRVNFISKMEKYFGFKKYMSQTVKKEVEGRVEQITSMITDITKSFVFEYYKSKGANLVVGKNDFDHIQSFFESRKKAHSVNKSEHGIINRIEVALVELLVEKLRQKQPATVSDFAISAIGMFDRLSNAFRVSHGEKSSEYELLSQTVDPNTRQKLMSEPQLQKTVRKKPQDIQIMCEVEAFQQSSGKTCLLATVDRKDMLRNASVIESLIGIKCRDPLYLAKEFF